MKSRKCLTIFFILEFTQIAFGVSFTDVTTTAHLENTPMARGSAWVDYDRDGYIDLFLGGEIGANRLYRNWEDGTFRNVTFQTRIPQTGGIWAVNYADIDNDGFEDLYMSVRAPDTIGAGRNILLRNTGTGYYIDISDTSGADVPGGGVAACFAPFSKESFVDIFVPNQYYPRPEYAVLLENTNGLSFVDRTEFYGLYAIDWWDVPLAFDYDNDTQLELFCTKDFSGGGMYDRINGPAFINVIDQLNINTPCGYGATIGDVNNDGWFDLYITNWRSYQVNLFIFDSTSGSYNNETFQWHAPNPAWTSAAHFADFDNDGWVDLFMTGAGTGNCLYMNDSGRDFFNFTDQAGLTNDHYNWGACIGDYDNDGFLDIFVPEYVSGNGRLYHNNGNNNNWVKFQLHGIYSNRDGIGARLILDTPNYHQIREVLAGSGYGSQNSLIQHFGIGADTIINRLEIRWPGVGSDIFENLPVNYQYDVYEGQEMSANDEPIQIPVSFAISNAYPNPFNGSVSFEIDTPGKQYLEVSILDILGNKVKTLYSQYTESRRLILLWDSKTDSGERAASGVYFCNVSNGIEIKSRKVVLLK